MSERVNKGLSWFCYAAIGLLLGGAGIIKVSDPDSFLSSVRTFELFGGWLQSAVVVYVPLLEVLLGVCLISGFLRRGAVWVSGLLLIAFILLVVQARLRGLSVDCGCFGTNTLSSDYEYAWKIGENLMMLLGLWAGVLFERGCKQS